MPKKFLHPFTISVLEVLNNIINTRFTVKSEYR